VISGGGRSCGAGQFAIYQLSGIGTSVRGRQAFTFVIGPIVDFFDARLNC
jgi:hypothetical protein